MAPICHTGGISLGNRSLVMAEMIRPVAARGNCLSQWKVQESQW
jgi:hypothetical protein